MAKPVLAILAAGMGSRYGGLKQIDPMDAHGNIIIDFDIYDAKKAGFEDLVFIIKKEIEADFKNNIGLRMEKRMNVSYAYQELNKLPAGFSVPEGRVKPWGTTHAVLCAREVIGKRPFAIINADDYYGPRAFQELYNFLSRGTDINAHAMVGYNIENTLTEYGSVARGICMVNEKAYLTDIVERTKVVKTEKCAAFTLDGEHYTDIPKGTVVSMNCWGFMEGIFDRLQANFSGNFEAGVRSNPLKYEDLLPNAVRYAIGDGKTSVKVLPTPDRWFGVTYKEDKESTIEALKALKAKGLYSEKLWE
ncbi:MAG TPA: sugar phosphate nucleotidyltransferase [Clostridia bacterium]|nr:sugar phosphate nucleotidyltransferase [Clostridia bacterium]